MQTSYFELACLQTEIRLSVTGHEKIGKRYDPKLFTMYLILNQESPTVPSLPVPGAVHAGSDF